MNIKNLLWTVLLLLALTVSLASCNFSDISQGPDAGNNGGEQPENPDNPAPENPEQPGDEGNSETKKALTYEEYINLTADEQEAYYLSFENVADFFLWHKEAKAKYDEEHKTPEIDGDIDIGDLLGPQE